MLLNEAYCEFIGYRREQLIGNSNYDFFPKEEADAFWAEDNRVLETGNPLISEGRFTDAQGGIHFIATRKSLYTDGDGNRFIVGVIREITERKRFEDALQTRDELLENLLNNSPSVIYIKDREGRFLKINRQFENIFGIRDEQIIGHSADKLFPHEIAERFRADDQQVLDAGTAMMFEEIVPQESGPHAYISTKFPLFDPSGALYAIGGISTDITERKHIEDGLRDGEGRFRHITENIQEVFWITSADFQQVHYVSPAYERIWGRTCERLYAHPSDWIEGIHPDDRARIMAEMLERVQRGRKFEVEYRVIGPDGSVRFVEDKGFPVVNGMGQVQRIVGVAADITERRRDEAALRESEARFRQLADSMPQIVWTARPDGYIDYYNQRWFEYTGFAEGYGQPSWEPILHPDDLQRCKDIFFGCIRSGEPFEMDYRFKDRFGGGYRWFMGRALPVRNEEGEIVRWFGTSTDIDDVKRAEKERELLLVNAQEARQEAEAANRAKDEFLAVVSHELRTPLTPILICTHMLKADSNPSQIERAMEMIERNVKLQLRLIEDLLDLNRMEMKKLNLERTEDDVSAILRSSVETMRGGAKQKRITLQLDGADEPLRIYADAGRLQQVFTNVLGNAVKFTPDGGAILVRLANEGDHATVKFQDTGEGIAPEFLPHVFEMFRQQEAGTQRAYPGLGIGLALVKSLVELHGGNIAVKSNGPGPGTEVTVRLPLLSSALGADPIRPQAASRVRSNGHNGAA